VHSFVCVLRGVTQSVGDVRGRPARGLSYPVLLEALLRAKETILDA
jgi:hypothetical protein